MEKTVPPIRLRAPEPEDLDVMMLFETMKINGRTALLPVLIPDIS